MNSRNNNAGNGPDIHSTSSTSAASSNSNGVVLGSEATPFSHRQRMDSDRTGDGDLFRRPSNSGQQHADLDASLNSTASAPANMSPSHPVLRRSNLDPPGQIETSHSVASAPPTAVPVSPPAPTTLSTPPTTTPTTTTQPGAYEVTFRRSGIPQVYRVTIPAGVRPGADFTVHAGTRRRVQVRCPAHSQPGQSLQITLAPESIPHYQPLRHAAPLTAPPTGGCHGGRVPMTPDVMRANQQVRAAGGAGPTTHLVTIPPDIYPGMKFTIQTAAGGPRVTVLCPHNAGPNMRVRIVLPTQPERPIVVAPKTQVFEVAVPYGVHPGQPFALLANHQRVLVTCPPNGVPGQKIRFQLPVLSQAVDQIQLTYESEQSGWKRTIRATDLKFQWTRVDNEIGDGCTVIEGNTFQQQFDFLKSAYVRNLDFLEGNDARMRSGTVELVPATEGVADSRLVVQNRTLISYADVHKMQGKSLGEKKVWFEGICEQLTAPWEDGHVKICVRRSHLLLDSVDAIMALSREDMRKRWRIEFLGEPAIDAGGPTKEWFELVSEQVFDPACGLWVPSTNNQACVDINPGSGALACLCSCVVLHWECMFLASHTTVIDHHRN